MCIQFKEGDAQAQTPKIQKICGNSQRPLEYHITGVQWLL